MDQNIKNINIDKLNVKYWLSLNGDSQYFSVSVTPEEEYDGAWAITSTEEPIYGMGQNYKYGITDKEIKLKPHWFPSMLTHCPVMHSLVSTKGIDKLDQNETAFAFLHLEGFSPISLHIQSPLQTIRETATRKEIINDPFSTNVWLKLMFLSKRVTRIFEFLRGTDIRFRNGHLLTTNTEAMYQILKEHGEIWRASVAPERVEKEFRHQKGTWLLSYAAEKPTVPHWIYDDLPFTPAANLHQVLQSQDIQQSDSAFEGGQLYSGSYHS